jgi:hypothetical protein
MSIAHPTEKERVALVDWLTANSIDIRTVPFHDSGLRIEERDGSRAICWTAYVLASNDRKQVDPEDPERVWMRDASEPCTVEPPTWLNVPGGGA